MGIKVGGKKGLNIPFPVFVDTSGFIVGRGLRGREMVEIGVQVFIEIDVETFWERHIGVTR